MKRSPPSSNLSSIFRIVRAFPSKSSPSPPPPSSLVSSAEKTLFESDTSSHETPSPSFSSFSSSSKSICAGSLLQLYSKKFSKLSSRSRTSYVKRTGGLAASKLNLDDSDKFDYLARKQLSSDISSVLSDTSPGPNIETEKLLETVLDIPWLSNTNPLLSSRQKEVSRVRKQKWVFKCTQDRRFQQLIKTCTEKIGAEAAMTVFQKLGRETGIKEYNALINVCIQKAKDADDDDIALQEVYNAYHLLGIMKEQGLELDEPTYGPLLRYLVDAGMENGFHHVTELVNGNSENSILKFSYYEMLLYVNINDEKKLRQLCDKAMATDEKEKHDVIGNYLMALCESGNLREEILLLLDVLDITRISSRRLVIEIFKWLGRQQKDSIAQKFLLAINDYGEVEDLSEFIFSYVANLPNLLVEDVILKYKSLHEKLKVVHSSASYEKLISHCCNLREVYTVLDLADEMVDIGLVLDLEVLHAILHAIEEAREYILVSRIRSLICRQNLIPNAETFRRLINLVIRMKDFNAAYDMLDDMEKQNVKPTATIYNIIMAGYFREKNFYRAKMVLKQMEAANVKPDSQTFSYLISNSDSEGEIIKYYEEMKQTGLQLTKQIYVSLISAYATCGQIEKAKQVMNEKRIPIKNLNEIKSALVSVLASNGQISDALGVYDEIKNNKSSLEPKAVLCIIDNLQREDGQLDRMLEVLKELEEADSDIWTDGCCRVLLYCVRFNHISVAVDLLKQLEDVTRDNEMGMEIVIDEVYSVVAEGDPAILQGGLDLFHAIKKDLGISPSRKVYDFLLTACVYTKSLENSLKIWKEYQDAGLPYNVVSFLRMYQALVACGDYMTAKVFRKKIPKDDPHVRYILEEYDRIYAGSTSQGEKKNKNKKKNSLPLQISKDDE
ncbi:hypothetical protein SAY86_013347 [Trapa natans]|uniref:PROP1-like PPR domain-containing protein n=1 Tax=Trapa natans TaxID=22666 RepID=A0AAN7MEA7_TRANT|nr:hypothetical protein SAY86_013347 [Trapa natans]